MTDEFKGEVYSPSDLPADAHVPGEDLDKEVDLTQCVVMPMEHLPEKGKIGITTAPDGKRYVVLNIEDGQGLVDDRKFLHMLRSNGVTSWPKYKKTLKEFSRSQYGEKHG